MEVRESETRDYALKTAGRELSRLETVIERLAAVRKQARELRNDAGQLSEMLCGSVEKPKNENVKRDTPDSALAILEQLVNDLHISVSWSKEILLNIHEEVRVDPIAKKTVGEME